VTRFREKPGAVEAKQTDGTLATAHEIEGWSDNRVKAVTYNLNDGSCSQMMVYTRYGDPCFDMVASEGDWIVRDRRGEYRVYKPDDFDATYEAVEP